MTFSELGLPGTICGSVQAEMSQSNIRLTDGPVDYTNKPKEELHFHVKACIKITKFLV